MDIYDIDAHLREMTPHTLKVLHVVYLSDGRWLTRAKVARGLGKRRLTPYDIECLKLLADRGIILESTQPTSAPGSDFAYVYNMTDEMADLLQQWAEWRETVAEATRRKPINILTHAGQAGER